MARKSKRLSLFKDPKKGLWIFGLLEILLGLTIQWGGFKEASFGRSIPEISNDLPNFWLGLYVFFTLLSGVWIVLGIGSILAKSWARTLSLIWSWCWLFIGIFVTIVIVGSVFFPMRTESRTHPEFLNLIFGFIGFGFFLGGICLPVAMFLFYRSRQVKAFCEAENPGKSWTSACPLPILVFVILESIFTFFYIITMPFHHFTLLFFGFVLSGIAGAVVSAGYTLLQVYIIWGFYRQRIEAWWTAVIFNFVFFTTSWLFSTPDKILEMDRRMGFSDAILTKMQKDQDFGHHHYWWAWASMAVYLGYFLWVKKYFRSSKPKAKKRVRSRVIKKGVKKR